MKNNKNIILLGGGGHCKSVIDVAESAGYNILGILDMPEDVGKQVLRSLVTELPECWVQQIMSLLQARQILITSITYHFVIEKILRVLLA